MHISKRFWGPVDVLGFSKNSRKFLRSWACLVAQLAKHPTFGFHSDHNLRVVGLSSVLGYSIVIFGGPHWLVAVRGLTKPWDKSTV